MHQTLADLGILLINLGQDSTKNQYRIGQQVRDLSGTLPMKRIRWLIYPEQEKTKLEAARGMTFKQCAEAYIESHKAGWKNAKHIWQWENTLERFVYPVFGKLPVQDIDVALVLKSLEPIWKTKTETATRVRGRIEMVIDWATAREYRKGENPARWRGKLESLLPAPAKIQKVMHRPALPYADLAAFMEALHKQEGLAAMALELTILSATRTSRFAKNSFLKCPLQFEVNRNMLVG